MATKRASDWKITLIGLTVEIILFSVIFMVLEEASLDTAVQASIVLAVAIRVFYKIRSLK